MSLWCQLYAGVGVTAIVDSEAKLSERCHYCHVVVLDFQEGFNATRRDNYGGGNTHWEESRLGAYATSEMRFMQIMEKLCSKESTTKSKAMSGGDSKTRWEIRI